MSAIPVLLIVILVLLLLMGGRKVFGRLLLTCLCLAVAVAGFVWFFSPAPPA